MNDNSAPAPYQIPQGQSPLVYPPNVTMVSPYSSCSWVPYGNTTNPQNDCPHGSQNVITPFIPLMLNPTFLATAKLAQTMIKHSVDDHNSTIIHTQPLLILHCSLIYFDCYSDEEINIIEQVLENYKWSSFELRLNEIRCHVDTLKAYITAEVDSESASSLWTLVRGIESAISAQGVKIKQPKIEQFHMTLAIVKYQYPSDCIVSKLKQNLLPFLPSHEFGSKKVCCFWLQKPGGEIERYFAQDCLLLEKLACR
ncbi:unnamed protein product [Didymodactylos carnosus]|uniref:Uncharacterized protein n=1 Tax=Didymodactylos carnosus TaxID=1234261 RepID=A0A814K4T8_9BILA|nr:unnamed protein product [Didymodactylos carnosus]CAF1044546.1 unnamed protein product [Didymodactylos carnosus]CAF3640360.1 unnamed protein product [Didymodactylos carnosus]CAF3814543.1 unnamed protein product [Didymodactylos carnosus]